METDFATLQLKADASLGDVKAAYRRLAKQYHPDAAGLSGDAGRFHQIHEAYRSLLKELGAGRPGPEGRSIIARAGRDWRFEGVKDRGAEVVYVVRLSSEAARQGLTLILPFKAEDACPRCLGEGHTLAPVFGGSSLMRVRCDKCGGSGLTRHNSTVRVDLTPDLVRRGRIRLKGLGHYRPTRGARGDLSIELRVGGATLGGLYTS